MPSHRFRGALAAAALLAPMAAGAHAVFERSDAQPNAFYRAALQITHGCEGSPTVSVSVTMPEGAVGARPMAKPGWTVATERGPYGRSYPFVHGPISEGVKRITWSGGTVPADFFDEFVFSVRISDDFRPGDVVHFPVEQVCERGRYAWVEIPAAGQDRRALREPAPAIRIVQGPAATAAPAGGAPGSPIRVGDIEIEQPWTRATPDGAKVAGGYLRITNRGSAPDRLVAVSSPIAGKSEVHEMRMDGGVMKMREAEGGIPIGPGEAVELKPGGYHLMFMDLRSGVKEGEAVQVSLTFEKAGMVGVTFRAAAVGARSAPEHRH